MATLNLRNPNGYDGQPATHTKQGIVRLATAAEVAARISNNTAVTPAELGGVLPIPLTVPFGGTGRTSLTDHALIIGDAAAPVTMLAPSATVGLPLVSAGASADPAYGVAVVAGGGSGRATATAYAVICGGTTATGAHQSIASVGSSGQVLTSNGASALPTFQAAPSPDLSSPPPIGDVAPNTGAFTEFTANATVGNVGISQTGSFSGLAINLVSVDGGIYLEGNDAGTITLDAGFIALIGLVSLESNLTFTGSGEGVIYNSPTATGAAASPVVVNGRTGAAVFSSVSIAGGADLTLTITNSSITGSSTQILYSLSGATSGSALSIKSVTNSAGSSAIVVTNGALLTTSTANITLTFIVLN